jgi:hypothetical protein
MTIAAIFTTSVCFDIHSADFWMYGIRKFPTVTPIDCSSAPSWCICWENCFCCAAHASSAVFARDAESPSWPYFDLSRSDSSSSVRIAELVRPPPNAFMMMAFCSLAVLPLASRWALRSVTAASRPPGPRMSSASWCSPMPISARALVAACDGAAISETVIRSRVAASSAPTELSVMVARAAPKSFMPRPAFLKEGSTPVPIAAASLSIFMSPMPTIVLR